MTAEDQGQLERYVESGKRCGCASTCKHIFKRAGGSGECVGEIRGRENAEQVLVVGAHLDSWDLRREPRTTAQARERAGSAEAMCAPATDAATIRFVLFTGEEEGLDGSFAYMKQHQSEMAIIWETWVLDEGQGR